MSDNDIDKRTVKVFYCTPLAKRGVKIPQVHYVPGFSGTPSDSNVRFEALATQMNALRYGVISAHQT